MTFLDIVNKLKEIKNSGYIKTHRKGQTGIGKTLEDLLGIVENNIPGPNALDIELKSQRKSAKSMITLFTKSPLPQKVNTVLLQRFGYQIPLDKLKKIDYTILKEVKNAKDNRTVGQRFELLSGKETQAVSEGERPRTETAIERQDRLVPGRAETKAGREAEVKPPEAKSKVPPEEEILSETPLKELSKEENRQKRVYYRFQYIRNISLKKIQQKADKEHGVSSFDNRNDLVDTGRRGEKKELHTTVNAVSFNTLKEKTGFKVDIRGDRINLITEQGEVVCYWDREALKKAFERKMPKLLYVEAETRGEGSGEEFWYNEATLLSGFNFDNFAGLLKEGAIKIDIRIGKFADGRTHDHGTGFRILPDKFDLCFEHRKRLL